MKKNDKNSFTVLVGAGVMTAFVAPTATAENNPFALNDLSGNTMHVAAANTQMKCGQGKCGAGMMKQGAQQANKPAPTPPQNANTGTAANTTTGGNAASPATQQTPPVKNQSNPK
ncbi:hypothetical protein F6R98_11045 [Candidatus Methylospira mobilis]|uniref:Secreted protein n=1 Tax=Candidatus Methylospira mobilis TaxID=1808979 RepID=A0A5Q0BHQ5_9GAMM|nr:hypothetical protein [Candidatus Methylospira mobilis]QFY43089.1 hypothetical protein F6R98_11045 [Candidatus Methylospira mobilis]